MSERHDPRTCHLCQEQAAEIRHPSYVCIRKMLFVPQARKAVKS